MFRSFLLAIAATLCVALIAEDTLARNPAYYGTRRKTSARVYSGQYQATRPNIVPTFSVPYYSGGRSYYRGGGYGGYYGGGYYPYYQQAIVIYPPRVVYGF